jgi:hypothetical protein
LIELIHEREYRTQIEMFTIIIFSIFLNIRCIDKF